MDIEILIFTLSFLFILAAAAVIRIWIKRGQEARSLARYNAVKLSGMLIPPTLHPVFDPTRCIGSGACTRVCPQGNSVVGRIQGRGVLIDPPMCIGHGRCAANCPVDAIRLVFGTAERGVDIPHLSPQFETNIPGMYITGELGGMGLIANAVRQAREGMTHLAKSLKSPRQDASTPDMVDVVIVGAGPAGLTSALFAVQHGLSYRLFDKESTVGGAILQYPRQKLVMTHPMNFPLLGQVRSGVMSKEQLVALFENAISAHGIRLEGGVRIENIAHHDDGTFTVTANSKAVRTRRVMLAIGRRGVPRKLGVKGESLTHVSYSIAEPDSFAGRKVLVVGGGDAAVESACMLAEVENTAVSLSFRSDAVIHAKPANRNRLDTLAKQGKIKLLPNTNVTEITPSHVNLTQNEKPLEIPADAIIIQIGGELPTALLQHLGITIERHFGEETEQNRNIDRDSDVYLRLRDQRRNKGLQNFHGERTGMPQWLMWAIRVFGAATLAFLFYTGRHYYLTPEAVRRGNQLLRYYSASGAFGHGLGIWAASLLGFNLLYFFRKEFRIFSEVGNIHTWMFFHQFSGTLAAVTVLLHTGLILYNAFAMAMYASLGIVFVTGVIGRYFFVMVPLDPRGRPLTHEALVDLSQRMENRFTDLYGDLDATIRIKKILDRSYHPKRSWPLLLVRLFTIWPYRSFQLARIFSKAQKKIQDTADLRSFKRYATEMARLRLQLEIAPRIKRILSFWRSGHALMAFMTIALVILHVFIEIWVGY